MIKNLRNGNSSIEGAEDWDRRKGRFCAVVADQTIEVTQKSIDPMSRQQNKIETYRLIFPKQLKF